MNIYAVKGVSMLDVENGTIAPDQTVVIENGRIQRIGARAVVDIPNDFCVIDGWGLYLIPGLVDAHVHFFDPPVFGRLMIANGVLLVREMGHPTGPAVELRNALNNGTVLGPEMLTTGSILDGNPPFIPPISIGVGTPEDGRGAVCKQAEADVDQIKVYSRLERDVFRAIVDEAARLDLQVVGHIPESVYVQDATAAGQRSIEHLHGFDKLIGKLLGEPITLQAGGIGADAHYWPRLAQVGRAELYLALEQIRDTGVTICPTVIVFKTAASWKITRTGEYPLHEYISPGICSILNSLWDSPQQQGAEMVWRPMQTFVGELYQVGMPLMIGTDLVFPGIIPGYSVHAEMEMWQEAGIPAIDVLRSATIVPARFMGLDGRLGTIAEGKTASMVLLKANPLDDIRNTRKIQGVFLRGRYFDRNALDHLLAEAREIARN